MKPEKMDWPFLQAALITFAVSLAVSSSLIAGAWYYDRQMQAKYNSDKARFQAISNQYLAVDQEEQLVRQYYPGFIELYNKGVVGPERRLNWIETLRQAGEEIKLPALKYQISSQIKYEPDYKVNTGPFAIYGSTMSLHLSMLHEGDLLKLFEKLNMEADGIYNVTECSFKRSGTGEINTEKMETANIVSECDLKWFNIKKSNGSEINISS